MASRQHDGVDDDSILEDELALLATDDPSDVQLDNALFQDTFQLQELEDGDVDRYCAECLYV